MNRHAHQAFLILRFAFTVAPIVAGIDKFLHLLTNWDKYLAPALPNMVGLHPHTFILFVGVVEIVAGLIVAISPRFGSYLVALWLLLIMINLVAIGGYLDVALRDLGLFLGAISLGRLAEAEAEVRVGVPAHA